MPIQRLQAGDRRIVIKFSCRLGLLHDRIETDDFSFDKVDGGRTIDRIDQALDAVDIVVRSQFAPYALECRVRCEMNALLDAKCVRLAAIGDLRHRFGSLRHQLRRACQVVVTQQRFEDRFHDPVRIQIRRQHRIETVVRRFKCHSHDLVRIGRIGSGRKRCGKCQTEYERTAHAAHDK